MQPEQPSDHQSPLGPTEQDEQEQSFGTDMRRAVDDLFTYQPIADLLQGQADNEPMQSLVNQRKQALVDALEEQAWRAVDDFLAELEHLQDNSDDLAGLLLNQRTDVEKRLD